MRLSRSFIYLLLSYLSLMRCQTMSNDNDPEIFMNVTEVIKLYNYPCENHNVVTEDGYILSLQRIPHGLKNSNGDNYFGFIHHKPVVFLQHGLLDSSFTWVNNAPDKSLAFILADAGFDVWLANSRGNAYSREHINYPSNSNKFWDFSWDEMVKYDLSASIMYVLSVSGAEKVSYIGHSQGTEIIFAKISQNSDLNSKISSVTALAPVVFLGNIKSGIRYLAHVAGSLDLLLQILGHREFLPNSKFTETLVKYVCGEKALIICSNLIFLMAGYDTNNLNFSRVPIYLAHTPAGTSSKNMVHYAQSYESNEFQMYDYGYLGNLVHYYQLHPPKYTLNMNGIPLAMFWGGNDWLADYDDVIRAEKELGDAIKFNKFIPEYNHLDFIWGVDAAKLIYPDIIEFIKKYIK